MKPLVWALALCALAAPLSAKTMTISVTLPWTTVTQGQSVSGQIDALGFLDTYEVVSGSISARVQDDPAAPAVFHGPYGAYIDYGQDGSEFERCPDGIGICYDVYDIFARRRVTRVVEEGETAVLRVNGAIRDSFSSTASSFTPPFFTRVSRDGCDDDGNGDLLRCYQSEQRTLRFRDGINGNWLLWTGLSGHEISMLNAGGALSFEIASTEGTFDMTEARASLTLNRLPIVPLPASTLLLGSALVLLGMRARPRQRS